ncbi:MAG: GNAT family N-acetyltransferase [Sphingorhabdus sp.]
MALKVDATDAYRNARKVQPAAVVPRPWVKLVSAAELLTDRELMACWEDIAAQASEPNPFSNRWYLEAALSALNDASDIRIATVWNYGLIGLIPLQVKPRYAGLPVSYLGNWLNYNAFLGTPLVVKDAENIFWQALFNFLDKLESQGLFLHLTGIRTDGKLAEALQCICEGQRRGFALVHREERALLERGLSPEAYLEANMRGKKRKELRRQHSRLAELGELKFERDDGSRNLGEWIAEFLELEKRGWKGANGSALDCAAETRQLFSGVLHGAAAAGQLELLSLRVDGQPVAMLVNFLTPPGAFSFKTAFDEDYARFSPGVLLQIENLKLLDCPDIEWCDSCAAQDHPMIDSIWSGRRTIGRYSVAIGGPVRRLAFAALLMAEKAKLRWRSQRG